MLRMNMRSVIPDFHCITEKRLESQMDLKSFTCNENNLTSYFYVFIKNPAIATKTAARIKAVRP